MELYDCTRNLEYFIDDCKILRILKNIPDDAQMLWTGGFFDDADICYSIIVRE